MKKLILIVFTVLLSATAFAQGIDFGIKAGVNFASITDASGLDNRTGFVAGFFAGGKLNDNLGIQVDLLYSQQGAEFELGSFDLDYINLPVVAKYYVSDVFNIQAGPQFGIVINEETQTVIGETINDIATNNFDVSVVLGLGLELPMGVRIEGRYNFGLSDVPDDKNLGFNEGRNSVITLSVGYSFL